MRMRYLSATVVAWCIALTGLLLTTARPAMSATNSGGVLTFHVESSALYSTDQDYRAVALPTLCSELRSSLADPGESAVAYVVAAFPDGVRRDLTSVSFSLEYDDPDVVLLDWGSFGEFEIAESGWPASGSGTAVTWEQSQRTQIVPVYWIAVGLYYSATATIAVGAATFSDSSIPSVLDPAAALGVLGFGEASCDLACPAPAPDAGPRSTVVAVRN